MCVQGEPCKPAATLLLVQGLGLEEFTPSKEISNYFKNPTSKCDSGLQLGKVTFNIYPEKKTMGMLKTDFFGLS